MNERDDIIIGGRDFLRYKMESGGYYKSIPCLMVLRLMDTEEYDGNYCGALELTLKVFPEADRAELEQELNKFI